jgi:hypothetical protein
MGTRFDESGNKVLRPGEVRFVVKSRKDGRHTSYGVYDRVTASYPITRPGLGNVRQWAATEEEAQTEADRCNKIVGGVR